MKKLKGTTILELIIALFILSVGFVGMINIARYPIEQAGFNIEKIKAHYIAKEAIEIIRNERDNLWLKEEDWDKNTIEIRTNHLNASPVYGTKFEREVFISEVEGGNALRIEVEVFWKRRGRNYEIKMEEIIYNWL